MEQERYLKQQIAFDLKKKMVFLGGPRQVGKTTLVKSFLSTKEGYLNWDITAHREKILKQRLSPSDLWIFDELHKYRLWRNYIKGLYDEFKDEKKILVTGSAKLDYYRYGGDSLQGRYHHLRLYPFSWAELKTAGEADWKALLTLGGFPEPLFSGSEKEAKRWSREYRNRMIREDLVELEKVQDLGRLELMVLRLPELVGSPLSINALREDLQVSHKAVSNWLEILERMYCIFRLTPLGGPKIRAVKKEKKHYHLDWSLVTEP
ncbi:MAG: ATP-binding protein, partial [Gammaproteobacteria bacterium]